MEQKMEQNQLHSKKQTQFFYGQDVQQQIGLRLKAEGATSILVVSDRKEFQRTHWYQQLLQSLQENGLHVCQYGGIKPQAELEDIEAGIARCKQQQIDWIIAVGGGTVIDGAKAIAMGAVCDHCIWQYFTTAQKPKNALPVSVLLTMPGSGSENNDQTMIYNADTLLKLTCRSSVLEPRHCFVNPEIFTTIPQMQLAQTMVLMLHRLICAYLLQVHAGQSLGQLQKLEQRMATLMRKARSLQQNRFDETAWMELVLLDSRRDDGFNGELQEDSCQRMAAELSAMCDVPYAVVLAVLLPAWLRYIAQQNQQDLLVFAQRVMGADPQLEPQQQIQAGIDRLEAFFLQLGLPNTLCELGIEAFCFKNAAQICTGYGWGQEHPSGTIQPLYWQDLYKIYQSVYRRPVLEETCSA